MAALRTWAEFGSVGGGINHIAANAVKRGLSSFKFESAMIAPVVISPKTQKNHCDDRAENNCGSGKIEHRAQQIAATGSTATKKRAGEKSRRVGNET
jgi:hypothetical protein